MKLQHWMKREVSGLAFTTLEICKEEERQGHTVCIRDPGSGNVLYGTPFAGNEYDCDLIHSQFPIAQYGSTRPKFLWCHGEPLSSVGNGVSMRVVMDLLPLVDAMICMRAEELAYWSMLKRTYLVPKGIDLDRFKPLSALDAEKLSGAPSVLYMEHWRQIRNPLPLIVAMQKVWKEYPEARLHLYNVTDKRMYETFRAIIDGAKLFPFVRTLNGPVKHTEVNTLLNRVDIVVSCLYPLYARSIEAFGAGKAMLCPGYRDPDYPWHCELDPDSIAKAIIDVWENGVGKFDFRGWAEKKHDVAETVRQSTAIYSRYLDIPHVAAG